MSPFKTALKDALIAYTTYFPLGIVFGILFLQLGYPWYFAPLTSLFVFSGTIQFILISTILAKGSVIALIVTAAFTTFRNCFYGLSVLDRYQTTPLKRHYLIFTLVDLTYSILVNKPVQKDDLKYVTWLSFLIQVSWVLGTFIGAYFASNEFTLPGLEFSLVALFTVFFVEQWKKKKDIALVVAAGATYLITHFFSPSLAFFAGLLVASGMILRKEVRWA